MATSRNPSLRAGPEQLRYASILEKGMLFGLLILLVTFAVYVFGIMGPYIQPDKMPEYWKLNVHDYLDKAHIEPGWAWLGMLKYGDFINFIGITILAGVTIICYLAIFPVLWQNNDKLYAFFALLEVLILSMAASGILAVGH
jgi:hypothetical protein